MENPSRLNLQTSDEVRKHGWQAESRDADGHMISCHAPLKADDQDIAEWIVECTSRGETVTFWPMDANIPTPQMHLSGSKAIEDVTNERRRQIEVEDFDASYDDMATSGQLAAAAATYAYSTTLSDRHRQYVSGIYSIDNSATLRELWPASWDKIWWKPTDRRRDLVKAAALLIAEIERLDRAALATEGKGNG